MKKTIITSTLLFMFSATNSNASTGEEIENQMTAWYNNTVDNCGDATKPAFLCSGIMLRAVETNPDALHLDPAPVDINDEGVSFSWLRADNNFSRLAYTPQNGYIFYPSQYIPESKFNDLSFLCFFSINADSFSRDSSGCGASISYPDTSKPCVQVGIHTANQWIEQFNVLGVNHYRFQCGWDIRQGQPNTAQIFKESILSRNLMTSNSWAIQNEMRVKNWKDNTAGTLPVHSFFYIKDNANALENARYDQRRYHNLYNQIIPIIEISLPQNKSEHADFNYINNSQEIGSGTPVSKSSPVVPMARGDNNDQLWRGNYYVMDALTIKIPAYEGMEEGQRINVAWRGPNQRLDYNDTTVVTDVDNTFFTIPRPHVIDAIGANARIEYSVLDLNGNTEVSKTTTLSIERQPMMLPVAHINLATRQATIRYPEMTDTQIVSLHWYGSINHDSEPQLASDSGTVIFNIPQEWIDENRGHNVYLNYSVEVNTSERNNFSRVLVVNVN